jgi:hypothetical protein
MRLVHGMYNTPTYISWSEMLRRCNDRKRNRWHAYGGRGIRVCKRWLSFTAFLADMGERPEGMTLDRKDSDGNYTPKNCRWATVSQQNRNKRKRHGMTSRFVGVSWFPSSRKWRATIMVEGRYVYLGLFSDEVEASKAYLKARSEIDPR